MENSCAEKSAITSFRGDSSTESFEKDLGAAIVPDHAQAIDVQTERRVLRKIDTCLIPWMWLGYGFVYYDKVSRSWLVAHEVSIFDKSRRY